MISIIIRFWGGVLLCYIGYGNPPLNSNYSPQWHARMKQIGRFLGPIMVLIHGFELLRYFFMSLH